MHTKNKTVEEDDFISVYILQHIMININHHHSQPMKVVLLYDILNLSSVHTIIFSGLALRSPICLRNAS
jgi:hypothetical protein